MILWGHGCPLLRAPSGSCDVQRHMDGLQFTEKCGCSSPACRCFGMDRKPDALRSRRHCQQRHLEKEKPERVVECSRTVQIRPDQPVWSHTPADAHLHVCCYPITALIEHCLTPFISWTDNKSFSVHISASRRHFIEKNWFNLLIPLLRFSPRSVMIWPRAGCVHFISVGGKLLSWRWWGFFPSVVPEIGSLVRRSSIFSSLANTLGVFSGFIILACSVSVL